MIKSDDVTRENMKKAIKVGHNFLIIYTKYQQPELLDL